MVVFGDEEGSWRLPESFSRTFRQQLARVRRPQPVNEQIRRSTSTRCAALTRSGCSRPASTPKSPIQERLGHETIGITMDIYSHVIPSTDKEAAAQLGSMLYSK